MALNPVTAPGAGTVPNPFRAHPGWALLGLLAGALAARVLIPERGYTSPGELVAAGVAFTLGLAFGPVISALRDPASIFRTEHLLMVGLFYWIFFETLQGKTGLPGVSYEAIQGAFLQSGLFAGAIWVGSMVATWTRPWRVPAVRQEADIGAQFLLFIAIAAFVLGGMRVWLGCQLSPLCIADSMFAARGQAAWLGSRFGNWDTVMHHLRYFGYLSLPLAIALHHREGRVSPRVLLAGLLGLVSLAFVVGDSSRRSVGTVVGASAMIWILLQPRIRPRHLAVVAGVVAALLIVMQAMVAWRGIGIETALREGSSLEFRKRGVAVDHNLKFLSHAVDAVPAAAPHTGHRGVLDIVAAPIPASILRIKPMQHAIDLPGLVGMRSPPGWTWTCSAVCDAWLIGGTPAVITFGLLFGVLANASSRLLMGSATIRRRLLYVICTMTLFVALRAAREVTLTGLAVVGMWGILFLRHLLTTPREVPLPQVPSPRALRPRTGPPAPP